MVDESVVKTPVKLFNLKWPPQTKQEFIGEALSFRTCDDPLTSHICDDIFLLEKITIVLGVNIINGELITIDNAIYEITDFRKPHDGLNYFESISLKHKGNL